MREDGVVAGTDADVTRIERIRNDRLANLGLRGAVFPIALLRSLDERLERRGDSAR